MNKSIAEVSRLIGLISLLLWVTNAHAKVFLTESDVDRPKAGDIVFLKENASAIPFEEALELKNTGKFKAFPKATPAFGFNTVAWTHFHINNPRTEDDERLLVISYPLLDNLKVYFVDPQDKLIAEYESGDHRKFSERPIADTNFVFPVKLPPGTSGVFIKAKSAGSVEIPISIWSKDAYYEKRQENVVVQGLYYGALLITLGYNLFVFFSVRSRSYLYYVGFVTTFLVFTAIMKGYFFHYVHPDNPELSDILLPLAIGLNLICTMAFMNAFLRVKDKNPRLYKHVKRYMQILGLLLVASPFMPYHIAIPLLSLLAGLQCLFALGVGLFELRSGVKEARFFVMAWAFYSVGGVLLALAKFGVIPTNALTANAQQIGSILEILLLSLALADRLNTLQEDNKRYIKELANHLEKVEALVNEKTRHIKSIMQYINQGIFTLLPDNVIGYRSDFLAKLYPESSSSEEGFELLTRGSNLPQEIIDQAKCTVETAFGEDPMQFDLNSHLLPSEIQYGDAIYEIDWSPMLDEAEEVEKVLVCVRDVTQLRALMAKDQENIEVLKSINEIINLEEQKFNRFMDRTGRTLRACSELIRDVYSEEQTRHILIHYHTIKGIARSLGLKNLSQTIHTAETDLINLKKDHGATWDKGKAMQVHATIIASHNNYYTVARDKLNRGNADLITIDVNDLEALAQDFGGVVADKIHDLFMMSSQELFKELAIQLSSVAERLEKQVPLFKITGEEKKFSGDTSDFLKDIFVHLIRNSLDHGIEATEVRVKKHKIVQGMITIDFRGDNILYRDDGAGLNIAKLKKVGIEKGLIDEDASQQTIAELIFNPGLSTADQVSEISGRGIGMDAVREQVQEKGGSIKLIIDESREDNFVGFHFKLYVPGLVATAGSEMTKDLSAS